ncbi:TetR/AcrR family transcriptional regulator [Kineosporia sp. R_H_3]|uniref:TetR/AcrR family transcriptional regulator n=1 Tax=Kineosporia sp. R_H_3 TaxID=1961848 RepID=UPI000B4B7546|nr:TetR family transcriptional regulator C-terminal domain-containing protein [Kineosporia sp. R_H_3]
MARPRNQSSRREALIEATYAAGREHGLRRLSLTDVAQQAGLTRGAVLYYYEDLDALLVEAHAAGLQRFCADRDAAVATQDDPRRQLDIAFTVGLPSGPDDALMRLLLELDVLAGTSSLHEELVQQLDRHQQATYRAILAAGVEQGVFRPTLSLDDLTLALVAMEDGFTLQIVADRIITHDAALQVMRSTAAGLGCPVLQEIP